MIRVEKLSKRFGSIQAVRGVSFRVRRGEVLGFLGPNGAGKTTTMRIITGFLFPTEGNVFIDGIDMEKYPIQAKQRIGYLPEANPLYGYMTPLGFLRLVACAKGIDISQRRKQIERVVEQCRLGEVLKRRIAKLSRGYKQRLGLAQALLGDPDIVVLDEPTSGLDPAQIIEIRELVRSLKGRKTVIVSTHILPEVNQLSDRIVIINKGSVVACGDQHDLQDKIMPYNELELVVEGSKTVVSSSLKRINGFVSCDIQPQADGTLRVFARFSKGVDSRAKVSWELTKMGLNLLELRTSGLSLEELYLAIVSRNENSEVA